MKEFIVLGDGIRDYFYESVGDNKQGFEGAKNSAIATYIQVKMRAGGAWNVAQGLRALGNVNVDSSYISYADSSKHRYFTNGVYTHRVDTCVGTYTTICPEEYADNIVVVDYNKGNITGEVLQYLADRPASSQLWIHTKKAPERYAGLGGVFFTNGREWPKSFVPDGLVVQTLGPHGIQLLLDAEVIDRYPSRTVDPSTVIGAGDYTMAGFIDACVNGGSYRNALEWSQEVVAHAMTDPYSCYLREGELNWQFKYGGKKRY